jgi:hypothetical protein
LNTSCSCTQHTQGTATVNYSATTGPRLCQKDESRKTQTYWVTVPWILSIVLQARHTATSRSDTHIIAAHEQPQKQSRFWYCSGTVAQCVVTPRATRPGDGVGVRRARAGSPPRFSHPSQHCTQEQKRPPGFLEKPTHASSPPTLRVRRQVPVVASWSTAEPQQAVSRMKTWETPALCSCAGLGGPTPRLRDTLRDNLNGAVTVLALPTSTLASWRATALASFASAADTAATKSSIKSSLRLSCPRKQEGDEGHHTFGHGEQEQA